MNATERRRINRANGAQSRGPLSDATKAVSSRNALKHGLRAAKYALPNEDPHEARDEAIRWLAHYRPRTEHQEELVGRIPSACTLQRRCRRACDATVAQQVLNAEADLDQAHEAEVDGFKARLVKEPAAAVAGLRRTALGCRWLIGRWHGLRQTLEELGTFAAAHHIHLARLRGLDPTVDRPDDPELLALRLHAVLSRPEPRPGDIDWAFQGVTPDVRAWYLSRWGDATANRQELRRWIDEAVAELGEREALLRSGREAVERATAADQALLIRDPEQARLWLRYSSESNSTYFRASRELQRSLEEDEGGAETCDEASSPNEPNDPAETSLNSDIEKSCGVSAAVVSEREAAGIPERDGVGASLKPAPTELTSPAEVLAGVGLQPAATTAPEAANSRPPNEPKGPPQTRSNSEFINLWVTKPAPISGSRSARPAPGSEARWEPIPGPAPDGLLRDLQRTVREAKQAPPRR